MAKREPVEFSVECQNPKARSFRSERKNSASLLPSSAMRVICPLVESVSVTTPWFASCWLCRPSNGCCSVRGERTRAGSLFAPRGNTTRRSSRVQLASNGFHVPSRFQFRTHRCRNTLAGYDSGVFCFGGRPSGRMVCSRCSSVTFWLTQSSPPNGRPLSRLTRSRLRSLALSGAFTRLFQSVGRLTGQGASNDFSSRSPCVLVHRLLQGHNSALSTRPAESGLRSTYRSKVKR
jgi:hypothetical protein